MVILVCLQNAVAIVPIQMKILTMAIKRQLENMVFLSNKTHPHTIILLCNFF